LQVFRLRRQLALAVIPRESRGIGRLFLAAREIAARARQPERPTSCCQRERDSNRLADASQSRSHRLHLRPTCLAAQHRQLMPKDHDL
jgi:hypothetical protein